MTAPTPAPREPDKDILKKADILAWIPGLSEYAFKQLVESGTLKPLAAFPKCRRFAKTHVYEVLMQRREEQP